jgi:DNA-binding transcriptional ArsR family regulator
MNKCGVSDRQLELLGCLSDKMRFRILLMLRDRELCVCDITKELKAEQSLISHHLQALRKCGFVKSVREGKNIRYKLADPCIIKLLTKIEEVSNKLSKCVVA